jgi:hypothetical protein
MLPPIWVEEGSLYARTRPYSVTSSRNWVGAESVNSYYAKNTVLSKTHTVKCAVACDPSQTDPLIYSGSHCRCCIFWRQLITQSVCIRLTFWMCWVLWHRFLMRGFAAARLLGLRVRVLSSIWISVFCECCASASGSSLARRSLPTVVFLNVH